MSKQLVSIIDVPKHVGEEITIGAWVANKSGKGKLAFLQLRDGTAFFQAVAFKPNFIEKYGEEEGTEKFDTVKRLNISLCDWCGQRRRTFKIWLRVGCDSSRSHR